MEQIKVDFQGFVLSLATGAAAALNDVESLRRGKPLGDAEEARDLSPEDVRKQTEAALTGARHLIDTLAMLEEKTKGNLSPEDTQVLQGALANLRITYVKMATPTS